MENRNNPNAPKTNPIESRNSQPNKVRRLDSQNLRECPKTSRHPDKKMSLKEFLNTKLPRKQAPKDLLLSIKKQLKADE